MAAYTIQKGDTLTKIAKNNNTTVAELAALNGIKNVNKISAGATIQLSAEPAAAAATPAPAAATTPAATTTTPAVSAASPVAATPQYTMPSDEALRAEAEALYNPAYQQYVDSINQQGQTTTTRYNQGVEDYGDYVEKTLKETQQSIENSLIKRNMGRSSRAAYEVTTGLADVNANAQEQLAELKQAYDDNMASLETQKQTLLSTKAQNVESKLLDLKNYYEQVRQYNESLAEQKRQFDEQMAASTSSSSGGGGGSGTTAVTAESVPLGSGSGTTSKTTTRGGASTTSSGLSTKDGKYYYNGKEITKSQYGKYLSIY